MSIRLLNGLEISRGYLSANEQQPITGSSLDLAYSQYTMDDLMSERSFDWIFHPYTFPLDGHVFTEYIKDNFMVNITEIGLGTRLV